MNLSNPIKDLIVALLLIQNRRDVDTCLKTVFNYFLLK